VIIKGCSDREIIPDYLGGLKVNTSVIKSERGRLKTQREREMTCSNGCRGQNDVIIGFENRILR
jgi:hypothetical protein